MSRRGIMLAVAKIMHIFDSRFEMEWGDQEKTLTNYVIRCANEVPRIEDRKWLTFVYELDQYIKRGLIGGRSMELCSSEHVSLMVYSVIRSLWFEGFCSTRGKSPILVTWQICTELLGIEPTHIEGMYRLLNETLRINLGPHYPRIPITHWDQLQQMQIEKIYDKFPLWEYKQLLTVYYRFYLIRSATLFIAETVMKDADEQEQEEQRNTIVYEERGGIPRGIMAMTNIDPMGYSSSSSSEEEEESSSSKELVSINPRPKKSIQQLLVEEDEIEMGAVLSAKPLLITEREEKPPETCMDIVHKSHSYKESGNLEEENNDPKQVEEKQEEEKDEDREEDSHPSPTKQETSIHTSIVTATSSNIGNTTMADTNIAAIPSNPENPMIDLIEIKTNDVVESESKRSSTLEEQQALEHCVTTTSCSSIQNNKDDNEKTEAKVQPTAVSIPESKATMP
jgi:hypothetical protein